MQVSLASRNAPGALPYLLSGAQWAVLDSSSQGVELGGWPEPCAAVAAKSSWCHVC